MVLNRQTGPRRYACFSEKNCVRVTFPHQPQRLRFVMEANIVLLKPPIAQTSFDHSFSISVCQEPFTVK